MNNPADTSIERSGLAAILLLTLAPLVVQGLWRPLAEALHAGVDTLGLSCASLVVAATLLVAHRATGGRSRAWPLILAALATLSASALLGDSARDMAAVAGALLGVALSGGALLPWLLRRLPPELDGEATRNKLATVLMIALGTQAVVGTARQASFMGDASRPELSLVPDLPFVVDHACLTAYVEGARLASEGVDNLYDEARWPDLHGTPRAAPAVGTYAPFSLDAYEYPPPFLLLPRVLLSWSGEFATQRAVWFAINGLFLAAGLWIVATWVGGRGSLRPLLLAIAVWASPPTSLTLQVGNAHVAVTVAAMLALVAFERRRPALGGALLAFAVLSKVTPGLLLIVLLIQRRYREAFWTAAFGIGFTVLALGTFGPDPFVAFVTYHLPRLASGEAFAFLAGPDSVPINLAPFGIPFKLAALGVDVGDPWAVARVINQVYSVGLVVVTVLAARRAGGRREMAEVWAALLTLGALRSPLAPGYVGFALLWLLSLRSVGIRGWGGGLGAATLWAYLSFVPPLRSTALIVYTLVLQCVLLTVTLYCLLRRLGPDESPASAVERAAA